MDAPNRNILWAKIFVDELAKCGLDSVCISPGSRSTPLTIAFAEHPNITVYSHLDERCAAYFALGRAMATHKPVAMVCTSGTAAANFFPAIIEAKQSQVPLLVLTADRPHELRESGANQTIDQVKMYGDQVLWSVEVAPPEANPSQLTLRYLRTLAARAYAKANGITKGAVHLNMPFRKPLEPILVESDRADKVVRDVNDHSLTQVSHGAVLPRIELVLMLVEIISQYEKGLIICGTHCPRDLTYFLNMLSKNSDYPIFADALSGVRFGLENAITCYDTYTEWEAPDVIIRFGNVPTSTAPNTYLGKITPKYHILINESGQWSDDSHSLTHLIQANPFLMCDSINKWIKSREESQWQMKLNAVEKHYWEAMDAALQNEFFDGVVVADVVEHAPEASTIFIGNSLPVRHLDQFGKPNKKGIRVLGNRGASGIDGVISSALGAATNSNRLILVIGDVSFYHDMNGLLAIQRCGIKNVTIVLLNNNGGGIFHRLPIAQFEPPFTDHFLTPHGLDFEPAIRMYGLHYTRADDRAAFINAFKGSLQSDQSCVIEVRTDARQDFERRKAVMEKVNQYIKEKVTG